MGATGPASAEGFEATYANPALLSRLRDRALSLGWQGVTFHLSATGPGQPGSVPYDPAKGVTIGVGLPLPFGGVLRDRIGLGLAFYTPSTLLVRANLVYPETPQFPLLPDRAQVLAVDLGVGVDLSHGVRVGGGFSTVAELTGTVVAATDSSGQVSTRVEDQLIAVYAPIVGAAYELPVGEGRPWRIGATYRGALSASFLVSLDGSKLTSLNIPILFIGGLAQYDPEQVALEGAYDHGGLLVAAGATYKRWSRYPGPLQPTLTCPSTDPTCGDLQPPSIGYHDTVALHVGADRAFPVSHALTAHARAGYFLEPTPLPSTIPSTSAYSASSMAVALVPTRYYDATRHAVTVGAGLESFPPAGGDGSTGKGRAAVTLDLYGQLHVLQPRTMTIAAPTPQSASGTVEASITGYVLVAGMVVGVKF